MDNAILILELKKKLTEEIQKESSDNNVILALSNEIIKLDDSQVRFSVDAGIINRLGKELVGKHETAVSELVKNFASNSRSIPYAPNTFSFRLFLVSNKFKIDSLKRE